MITKIESSTEGSRVKSVDPDADNQCVMVSDKHLQQMFLYFLWVSSTTERSVKWYSCSTLSFPLAFILATLDLNTTCKHFDAQVNYVSWVNKPVVSK